MSKKIISLILVFIMLMGVCIFAQDTEEITLAEFLGIEVNNTKSITLTSMDSKIVTVDSDSFYAVADSIILTLQTDVKPTDRDGMFITAEKTDGTFGNAYITAKGEVDKYSQFMSRMPCAMYIADDKEILKKLFAFIPNGTVNAIKASDWAKDALTEVQDKKIIPDTIGNINDYTQNITREQFSEIAAALLKKTASKFEVWFITSALKNPFEDTNNISVIALYNEGIIEGKDEKTFAPNDFITREEAATMLSRMDAYIQITLDLPYIPLTDFVPYYDDIIISSYANEPIYRMKYMGIMGGIGNNLFAPQDHYTVEQAIATMLRLHDFWASRILANNVVEFLPSIEVKGDYISPPDGVGVDVAKRLIVKCLADNGVQGDISNNIKIEEITIEQAWENNKMQIYSFELGYAWLYNAVAVIADGECVGFTGGMPTEAVYLADINNDGYYEVCTNALFGSGFIDMRIHVLDVHNKKQYELSKRFEYDLILGIDDTTKELLVYRHGADVHDEKNLLGHLFIQDERLMIVSKNGNRVYSAVINYGSSNKFSASPEISSAINCVLEKFKDFNGCELMDLWYDEEKSEKFIDGYMSNGHGSINGVDRKNVIVLLSNFYVNPVGAEGSLNPDSVYSNWNWILIRDNPQSEWKVDDWGY